MPELGLSTSISWPATIGMAVAWLALMVAYSPLADRIATRWVATPPSLNAFRPLQQSTGKLILGILIAWILGGFIEEVVLRGIVLTATETCLSARLNGLVATALAIIAAAAGAGLVHLYQGLRAAIIITQLSILFGLLFVISGHNLWAVILCHGLYDTIAFIRFATGRSKYSQSDAE